MKRRTFLQSIGAIGLTPMMPAPLLSAAPAASAVVAKDTYMWAETIVRAHNKCNLGMLQRLLQIDNATASVLKSELLKNGVISAQANAYGMHSAIKPLYEGAFVRPTSEIGKLKNPLNTLEEKQNNISALEEVDESISDQVESVSETPESISEDEKPNAQPSLNADDNHANIQEASS